MTDSMVKLITFFALMAIIYEFLDLGEKCGIVAKKQYALLALISILSLQVIFPKNNLLPFAASTFFFVTLLKKEEQLNLKVTRALIFFAISVYVSLTFLIISELIDQHRIEELGLFYCSIVTRDTASAVYGYFIKGRITLTQLSPNKTLEGAIFGLLMTLALQYIFVWKFQYPIFLAIIQGITIGILGQTGDLIESAIKRAVNIRHSGHIFGSRGGILDLLDSALFTLPFWYLIMSVLTY